MLIILAGLPGTGKSTIARHLADRTNGFHIRIDTIEQALRSGDVLLNDVGPTGYIVGYALAGDNLRLGRTVIADSVNPLQVTRDAWRSVALRNGSRFLDVLVTCSNLAEHRRRIEMRVPDIPGLLQPDWQDVVGRRTDPWTSTPLIVDTALKDVEEIISDIVAGVDQASA